MWTASVSAILCAISLSSATAKKLPNVQRPHPPDHHHAEPAHSYVAKLHADTFDAHVANSSFLVVLFYAPWCGHCRMLAPEYTEASVLLANARLNVHMAKIDMHRPENEQLGEQYGVKGFPTVKIFKAPDKRPWDYRGPRDREGIANHLTVERQRCGSCPGPVYLEAEPEPEPDEDDDLGTGDGHG